MILEDHQSPPKSGRPTKRSSEGNPPKTPPTPGPVLIVEDHPDGRMMLVDLLEMAGYEVKSAANGQEALNLLKASENGPLPCLILLDLYMPVMDGWEFLHRQNQEERLREIPVVVLSAVARRAEWEATDLKPVAFLEKPVSPKDLFRTVEHHCSKRSDSL